MKKNLRATDFEVIIVEGGKTYRYPVEGWVIATDGRSLEPVYAKGDTPSSEGPQSSVHLSQKEPTS